MPAALTDFLAIAALVVFGQTFGVAAKDISVAATLLLAIVGFMILHNISMPMNKFRIGVIAGCAAGLVAAIATLRGLFDIHAVSLQCFMLFVVFAIAVIPCMRLLTRFFAFIGSKINP
jgi:cation-transporting ATPase E